MSISASYLARRLQAVLPWETHFIEQIAALGERRISSTQQLNHLSLNTRVKIQVDEILRMIPRGSPGSREQNFSPLASPHSPTTAIHASPRHTPRMRPVRLSNSNEANPGFIEAINRGDFDSADAMIDGGHVSQKDVDRALFNAIESVLDDSTIVYLFNRGANPLASTEPGQSGVFELAIERNNEIAILLFASYGFTPAQHRFFKAARENDIASVREIYDSGGGETIFERRRGFSLASRIKEKFGYSELSYSMLTTSDSITAALYVARIYAIAWDSQEVINFLKEFGPIGSLTIAEIMFSWAGIAELASLIRNLELDHESTLTYAAMTGRNDVIEFMKRENITETNKFVLEAAMNYPETVKLLTTLPGYDFTKSVGLVTAAEYGKYDLVTFFYDMGERDVDTALDLAVQTPYLNGEYIRIVDFLVEKGAKLGDLFDSVREYTMRLHLLRLLKQQGESNSKILKIVSKTNDARLFNDVIEGLTDDDVASALPFAVKERAFNIVPLIIERGGDPNGRGIGGTHAQVAVANNDLSTLTALYDGGAVFDKSLEERALRLGFRNLAQYIREKNVKIVYRPTTVESIIEFDRIPEGEPYSMCSLNERHVWGYTSRVQECPFKDGGGVREEKFINRVDPSVRRVHRPTEDVAIVDIEEGTWEKLNKGEEYVMCSHNDSHIWLPDSRLTACPIDDAKAHPVVYINTWE